MRYHILSDEEVTAVHQHATTSLGTTAWGEVTLNPCQAPPPVPVVTTVAPVRERQPLYISARECLSAVDAADGAARWCQEVKMIREREVIYPPGMSVPPPPRVTFGHPRAVNGVVYVGAYVFDGYTCALNADDGSLRWRTPTDAGAAGMPFMDWAVPLVSDGIVYNGTYALNERDGTVLWRIAVDTRVGVTQGKLALHALADDTLFATTQMGIYAIDAQDGQVRWFHPPDERRYLGGPPVVAGRLLYAGTGGSVGRTEKSHCFALDVETGVEAWRYPMGPYIGAVVRRETIYAASCDGCLYALDAKSGMLRWRHPFAASALYPLTIADDVLYINTADGIYALGSEDGLVLWNQPLGGGPGVSFTFDTPPVVLDGAVFVVRIDNRGRGVLYALDTRTGVECWHTPYPSALALSQ